MHEAGHLSAGPAEPPHRRTADQAGRQEAARKSPRTAYQDANRLQGLLAALARLPLAPELVRHSEAAKGAAARFTHAAQSLHEELRSERTSISDGLEVALAADHQVLQETLEHVQREAIEAHRSATLIDVASTRNLVAQLLIGCVLMGLAIIVLLRRYLLPRMRALSSGVKAIARGMGLRVIAECVETGAQLDLLRHQGCDEVQGYHLGAPADPRELMQRLADDERLRPYAQAQDILRRA